MQRAIEFLQRLVSIDGVQSFRCFHRMPPSSDRSLHDTGNRRKKSVPNLTVEWTAKPSIFNADHIDWFHLEKKCGEYPGMALAGRALRKEVLHLLADYLWLGRVDDAITYLQHLSADRIKSQQWLDQTVDYLQRHHEKIPCYALRRALGLRNSSNRGEKANDRCVADRQKHKGMSGSSDGSTRLTSTTTLLRNHECDRWCQD